jgi:transcriptional regulator with XRE-family HTH domain
MQTLCKCSQEVRSPSPLRALRQAQGLTVEDLASRASVSGRTVISAEVGEHFPYPATRRCLAMALGVAEQALWPVNDRDPVGGRVEVTTGGTHDAHAQG